MSTIGWYYLHVNGDLIYKSGLDDTAVDLRESDFVKTFWPVDPHDRAGAWHILVESLAAGARLKDVTELAAKWRCNNDDAAKYAEHIGVNLYLDGSAWCATRADFQNLQESKAGFGDTCLEALANLCRELGYRPQKLWGSTFAGLVQS